MVEDHCKEAGRKGQGVWERRGVCWELKGRMQGRGQDY